MKPDDVSRIAAAISTYRPDWMASSLVTLMRNRGRDESGPVLAALPARDVAIAFTWVALDPDTNTPARVLESGPWWNATRERASTEQPPRFKPAPPLTEAEQAARHDAYRRGAADARAILARQREQRREQPRRRTSDTPTLDTPPRSRRT